MDFKVKTAAYDALIPISLGTYAYGAFTLFELGNPQKTPELKVVTIVFTAFCTLASIYGTYQRANYYADETERKCTLAYPNQRPKTKREKEYFEAQVRDTQGGMVMGLCILSVSLRVAGVFGKYRNPTRL